MGSISSGAAGAMSVVLVGVGSIMELPLVAGS